MLIRIFNSFLNKGIVANMLDYDIVVSEFEPQVCH